MRNKYSLEKIFAHIQFMLFLFLSNEFIKSSVVIVSIEFELSNCNTMTEKFNKKSK